MKCVRLFDVFLLQPSHCANAAFRVPFRVLVKLVMDFCDPKDVAVDLEMD